MARRTGSGHVHLWCNRQITTVAAGARPVGARRRRQVCVGNNVFHQGGGASRRGPALPCPNQATNRREKTLSTGCSSMDRQELFMIEEGSREAPEIMKRREMFRKRDETLPYQRKNTIDDTPEHVRSAKYLTDNICIVYPINTTITQYERTK